MPGPGFHKYIHSWTRDLANKWVLDNHTPHDGSPPPLHGSISENQSQWFRNGDRGGGLEVQSPLISTSCKAPGGNAANDSAELVWVGVHTEIWTGTMGYYWHVSLLKVRQCPHRATMAQESVLPGSMSWVGPLGSCWPSSHPILLLSHVLTLFSRY